MKASEAIKQLHQKQQETDKRLETIEGGIALILQKLDDEDPEIDLDLGDADETPAPAAAAATPGDVPKPEDWAWREVGGSIEFKPPNKAQKLMRQQLIPQIGFEHWRYQDPNQGGEGSQPLPPEEAGPAYIAGGPGWLYHYDRSFVLSLPPHVKAAMAADVQINSPTQANEMGRDLLMARSDEDQPTSQIMIDADVAYRQTHGGKTGAK